MRGINIIMLNILVVSFNTVRAQVTTEPAALKKLSMEELLNLEVMSVSRREEKLATAPAAIQVITAEDIRRSGATSLPEALRLADNIQMGQKNSSAWAITTRGFNTDLANKLLVLVDGRTVYTPLFSGVFWDRQDYLLEDIERIEVISGPGGTLWGSNAVNGVINIITKKAEATKGLFAEAGGGTQLRHFAGLRYGTALGATHVRVYGKLFDRDESILADGTEPNDAWRMQQGGFRLDTHLSQKDELTVQGDFYTGTSNFPTGGRGGVDGMNILSRWTRAFSENSNLRMQAYYDRSYLNQPVPETVSGDGQTVLAPAGTLRDILNTADFDLQHHLRLGEHNRLVWGVGFRYTNDNVFNAPALAFSPAKLERNLLSCFVQDEIRLADFLTITVGAKAEHNDYTGFEFEPNIRLHTNLSSNQTIWGAVSRAVRIPSRVDRHIRLPTPAFSPVIDNLLVGGADFDSETMVAYELGYRANAGSKVTGSLSAFFNVYDKIRSTSASPPPALFGLPLFYENNLKGETYGIETSVHYQVTKSWRLRAGYTLLRENIWIRSGKTDFNNALNETADPDYWFSVRSYVDLPKSLEWSVGFRGVDEFTYNTSGVPSTMPEYVEMESRLAWYPAKNFEISITGMNLLNKRHLEYVIASPNPRSEVERSFYVKIACRF